MGDPEFASMLTVLYIPDSWSEEVIQSNLHHIETIPLPLVYIHLDLTSKEILHHQE